MTRAKERLTLTHAATRSLYGTRSYNLPSRFLDELPQRERRARAAAARVVVVLRPATVTSSRRARTCPTLATGDSVRHGTLGEGVVAARSRPGGVVTVRFARTAPSGG